MIRLSWPHSYLPRQVSTHKGCQAKASESQVPMMLFKHHGCDCVMWWILGLDIAAFDNGWNSVVYNKARVLLYALQVSHIVVCHCPGLSLDTSYIRLFRALDHTRFVTDWYNVEVCWCTGCIRGSAQVSLQYQYCSGTNITIQSGFFFKMCCSLQSPKSVKMSVNANEVNAQLWELSKVCRRKSILLVPIFSTCLRPVLLLSSI